MCTHFKLLGLSGQSKKTFNNLCEIIFKNISDGVSIACNILRSSSLSPPDQCLLLVDFYTTDWKAVGLQSFNAAFPDQLRSLHKVVHGHRSLQLLPNTGSARCQCSQLHQQDLHSNPGIYLSIQLNLQKFLELINESYSASSRNVV